MLYVYIEITKFRILMVFKWFIYIQMESHFFFMHDYEVIATYQFIPAGAGLTGSTTFMVLFIARGLFVLGLHFFT